MWLDFEGSFRNTTVWINGALAAQHDCGYTPFRVRLDNLTSVAYGAKSTVAVYVDPDNGDLGGRESGSGWWYEGGGLYRPVHIVRASTVHIEQDGLFAYSNVSLANAGDAASATVHASAAVVNTGAAAADVCVTFSIAAPDGAAAAAAARRAALHRRRRLRRRARHDAVAAPRLWSSASPTLYSVSAAVGACGADDGDRSAPAYRSSSAAASDALTVPHGFRTLRYDADDGFFLNEEHFKVRGRAIRRNSGAIRRNSAENFAQLSDALTGVVYQVRGFCDHTNFAVVGMAVPPRVNLFRAQASRAVGGNGRRTSHNPPDRGLLEIYDRVGITVMDENRTHHVTLEHSGGRTVPSLSPRAPSLCRPLRQRVEIRDEHGRLGEARPQPPGGRDLELLQRGRLRGRARGRRAGVPRDRVRVRRLATNAGEHVHFGDLL